MSKYEYRGPVDRSKENNWPDGVVFEDLYCSQQDGNYVQVYKSAFGQHYKVTIRINTYDFQSYGKLYILRPTGWVEYITVEATLLKSLAYGPFYHGHSGINKIHNPEVLESFRSDALEILNILIKNNQGERNDIS